MVLLPRSPQAMTSRGFLNQDNHLIMIFSLTEPSTPGLNYDIPYGTSRISM